MLHLIVIVMVICVAIAAWRVVLGLAIIGTIGFACFYIVAFTFGLAFYSTNDPAPLMANERNICQFHGAPDDKTPSTYTSPGCSYGKYDPSDPVVVAARSEAQRQTAGNLVRVVQSDQIVQSKTIVARDLSGYTWTSRDGGATWCNVSNYCDHKAPY